MFIAEVKTQSPFGFESAHSFDELLELAAAFGDRVAVHTDPRWGGSLDNITKAQLKTLKPIVAKGIHSSDDEIKAALSYGASYVWVVGRIPQSFELDPHDLIIEPMNIEQLKMIPSSYTAVWNRRDLSTGEDRGLWDWAREVRKGIGPLGVASFIKSVQEIPRGADFHIVGSHLHEYCSSA